MTQKEKHDMEIGRIVLDCALDGYLVGVCWDEHSGRFAVRLEGSDGFSAETSHGSLLRALQQAQEAVKAEKKGFKSKPKITRVPLVLVKR